MDTNVIEKIKTGQFGLREFLSALYYSSKDEEFSQECYKRFKKRTRIEIALCVIRNFIFLLDIKISFNFLEMESKKRLEELKSEKSKGFPAQLLPLLESEKEIISKKDELLKNAHDLLHKATQEPNKAVEYRREADCLFKKVKQLKKTIPNKQQEIKKIKNILLEKYENECNFLEILIDILSDLNNSDILEEK